MQRGAARCGSFTRRQGGSLHPPVSETRVPAARQPAPDGNQRTKWRKKWIWMASMWIRKGRRRDKISRRSWRKLSLWLLLLMKTTTTMTIVIIILSLALSLTHTHTSTCISFIPRVHSLYAHAIPCTHVHARLLHVGLSQRVIIITQVRLLLSGNKLSVYITLNTLCTDKRCCQNKSSLKNEPSPKLNTH